MTKQHRQQWKTRKAAAIAAWARQRNNQDRLGILAYGADPATKISAAKAAVERKKPPTEKG